MRTVWNSLLLCCAIIAGLFGTAPLHAAPRLIGWWTMDEEPGATTLTDSSGYGRTATLGTGVTVVDGRFGKAAYFDGSTDAWARFNSSTLLTNFTLSVWFNVPQAYTTNSYPKLFQLNTLYYQFTKDLPNRFNIGLGTTPTAQNPTYSRAEWTTVDQTPFKFTTNVWTHAALVIRRTYTNATDWVAQPVFYLNGIRCGTDAHAAKTYSPDTIGASFGFLGNTAIGGTRALVGALDDARIYNEALTDPEILALYHNSPAAAHAGTDQDVFRDATRLQGRLFSTRSFTRQLAVTSVWSVVSAPEGAAPVIEHPDIPETGVTLPVPGTYVFRLSAFSELGNTSDDVTVERLADAPADNAAPNVTASWAATGTVLGASAPLAAAVIDDGTPGPARLRWSKVSGPGAVFFDNAFTNVTAASFSTNGTYVVRLAADDGAASDADDITVTVSAPAGDLADGLTHWWRMDDEPTDKKATDSSGNLTVSLALSALLQPGKLGLGLRTPRLDAVGIGSTFPVYSTNMTFSFWFYHDDAYVNRAGGNTIQRVYNIGPNFYILYNPSTRKFDLSSRGIGTGGTQHTWQWPDVGITSNRWFHAAFLFNGNPAPKGSQQTMYLDGVKVLSNPYTTTNFPGAVDFTTPFVVANNGPSGGTRNFDGVLDELRIYSRFLAEEEIRRLAADPDNNHAPVIEAAPAMTVKTGRPVSALATAVDDGQPAGATLATAWSVVAGDPAHVDFAEPSDPATAVTFTQSGVYTLRLDASDGELRNAVNVRVTATPTGTLLMVQ
jgi:hypothetical protein